MPQDEVYIVVQFTYPEGDWPGEFDNIVMVTPDKELADYEASKDKLRQVEKAQYYG